MIPSNKDSISLNNKVVCMQETSLLHLTLDSTPSLSFTHLIKSYK